MSVTPDLKIGDRFRCHPQYTGLGKEYWYIITEIVPNGFKVEIDGEYIEPTDA